ncbi:Protein kinase domain and Serine/threonine-/dual specificity protein kinase, catalytic domain and Protein kinase-like domain-containing protein [Strongyloides ratti]|uniref:non-specific serine/threonine protein kinase n=1 Tax=Strongyloides ratti TaxID=34506 RepID=A0A090LI47_STRRB|nr:Protein kinase domain and Serine/threonine-/dual specificity protein kinase, catalytic domain and Protein kinase-like domain-containing protein [Strongyloides ratti]CEF69417.1 Protein kinase domain and Serine/threonine-/dual specificity protein kinase, catalytic domain and Protein kinase-like domain-containing protein [Strongyloides ratti]
MQLKFMLFVILTLLFATYSDCLKCYQNLDESKPKAIEITKEDTEVTCKAGDVCSTFVMKSYGKKSSYIRISSCKPKKNCEDVKKDDGKEFSGEEAYKKLESLFGPHDGESTAVSKAKILNKIVHTKRGTYTIDKLLGEGGYGFVYNVTCKEDNQKYAMKIERESRLGSNPKLKMEVKILKDLASVNCPKSHFVKLYDRCKKKDYYLIVIDLLGLSLFELKKKCKNLEFSDSTAFNVGIQCLESIEELHKFNFIHRDIKPTNFVIGLEDKNNIIYLIDFGLSRYILNEKGSLKTPREMCKFKGTTRYASLATHNGIECGRKDDIEAWIYMFIEFLPRFNLQWITLKRFNDVLKRKYMLRKEWADIFNNSKYMKFHLLLDYVDDLSYVNKIDYNYLYTVVKNIADTSNIDLTKPLDWTIKK